MKKAFLAVILILCFNQVKSSVPQSISYQSLLRDTNGILLHKQEVSVKISILQGASEGEVVYVENHKKPTNTNGLISLEIGLGSTNVGDFTSIDWSAGPYFLKSEVDLDGGDNYTLESTTQLLSVPFALHANTASEITGESSQIKNLENQLEEIQNTLPDQEVVTVLPTKLYFVKDFESCLYHENVLMKDLETSATLIADKGVNYSRLSNFNFDEISSEDEINFKVISNFKTSDDRNISYQVVDPSVNNGKSVSILAIGDSFTDRGTWVKRYTDLLESDGVNVVQIGTTGNSSFKAEGLSGGRLANVFLNSSTGVSRIVEVSGLSQIPATRYPGTFYTDANGKQWSIRGGVTDVNGNGHIVVTNYQATESDFNNFPLGGVLTKVSGQNYKEGDEEINYTNPQKAFYNPFINPSTDELDLSHYIDFWEFDEPEIVVFQFTWNDLNTWRTDEQIQNVVNGFIEAVTHVHMEYPNAKVILSVEPCGSINGNRDWNGKKYTVLKFASKLIETFELNDDYNSYVFVAPSYAFVDLKYGYNTGTITPSSKYPEVTEHSGGDGVHPSDQGMEQIGECVYQIISNLLIEE